MNSKNIEHIKSCQPAIFKICAVILLLFILTGLPTLGQTTGNEWINLDQKYYRIPISTTGLYKISKDELLGFDVPITSYDPQQMQLFFNGEEIPCYIEGESQGDLKNLYFYAKKNDAWFDKAIYDDTANQANPYYSMITDTASVFITWNSSYNNLRYSTSSDQDFTGYTAASYCYNEVITSYISSYYNAANNCSYTAGEGWADNTAIKKGGSVTKQIATPNPYNGNATATVAWSFITYSTQDHHITIDAPGYYTDTTFYGYKNIKGASSVAASEISATNKIIFSSIDDNDSETDYSAASYIRIKYPMLFDFEDNTSFTFEIPASASKATYLEIENFTHNNEAVIYDLTNNKRITTTISNDVVKALIPASSTASKLIICNADAYNSVSKIEACSFTDYSNNNKAYIIISNSKLWDAAQEYATYRNALLVNVNELYNEFGYGIQKHPMAIRNFLTYIQNNWTTQPEHLFIIGKGVSAAGDSKYAGYRKNTTAYTNCFVPPMGNPASDVLLSAYTDESTSTSTIATGRLSALNATQTEQYLEKVKEFESNEPAEWMKNVIHFGGGSTTSDQATFASYLKGFENSIEDTLFGGYVSTFLKSSSDPMEITQSDSVENLINNGTSLITFFGHGTTSGFDQNIDEPSAFSNYGKYPLITANSCYSGNIFYPGQYSTSEDWVLASNKGSIGFLAMVYQGVASYLNIFSSRFYRNLALTMYGESLGSILKATRAQIVAQYPSSEYVLNTAQEFTLHGDPAIVLNSFAKPDLYLSEESVWFTPSTITTEADSFIVNISILNIAMATADTFALSLTRTFPDGSVIDTQLFISGLYYKDTITVKYPINQVKGVGTNQFYAFIDANDKIDEINEANNTTTVSTYISSADLVATYPYEYSIVPEAPDTLIAVTGDVFTESATSIFQIDTTYLFNSPLFTSNEITHDGGIVNWTPGINFNENQIYFWRTGASNATSTQKWSTSSFCYKNGKSGWLQGSFGQLIDNTYSFIEANEEEENFSFKTTPKRLSCHDIGSPSQSTYYKIRYAIDDITDYSSCGTSAAMLLVVIDTMNLEPWESDRDEDFGHINYPYCSSRSRNDLYFVFPASSSYLLSLANVIDNYVPDGYHILIYSFNKVAYQDWSETLFQRFENWGADNIRFQANYYPYIFYTVKGDVSQSVEVLGTSTTDIIDLNIDLKTNFTYGDITSLLIGPAQNWEEIEWACHQQEENTDETNYLKVYGVDNSGNSTLLKDSVTDNSLTITDISIDQYPYLKLGFHTYDPTYKTPGQLDYWQVEYTPLTDLVINPTEAYEFYSDTLQQGETGSMTLAYKNIGSQDADSLLVKYWLTNSQNKNYVLSYHRLAALKAGANITDTISFETLNYSGNMNLYTEINPINPETDSYDQPEQNHYNNLAKRAFYIKQDDSNPVVDVTFDGIHIMDGDIVSAKPQIVIQVQDENQYIALDDTSTFSVYLTSQTSGEETKIQITNNSQVTFIPAELPKNKAQLIYTPEFDTDGIYELRVRAKDATGNESGDTDYQISFEVITESTITNVFNYPNPFSTSTRFVFELTGSEIPDEIRIDILTVTGKVVKIIYAEDLGTLKIGKNITDYAWDGRDMYGDPLANGVYFYKVSFRLNGEELKKRDTDTNKFFKNGYGKMYIMR